MFARSRSKRIRKSQIKPPRIVPKCDLEYSDKEFKTWLDNYIDDLVAESKESLNRSSFVMEAMPLGLYLKMAPIFSFDHTRPTRLEGRNRCKMTVLCEEEDKEVEEFIHLVATEIGFREDRSMDEQVDVGTLRRSVRDDPDEAVVTIDNPYLKFLKRASISPELAMTRQTLSRRSKEITRLIIGEFLEWYQSLGGEDEETTIDETILQDLFQIGFDSPTARAIALRITEMPVVNENLAAIRNEPEFAIGYALKKLIKADIKLEQRPPKLFAFGTMLPKEEPPLRYQPPKNKVKKTWTECQRVPSELESLRVVWEGIENLRSTIAFSNWLKQHPEITPPKYLAEKGLLDINYEEWMQVFRGFEVDVESEGVEMDARMRTIIGDTGDEDTDTLLHRSVTEGKLSKISGLRSVSSVFGASSMSLYWK